jgi:ubiquinone/menaquinone biosynthesis C-methylase UbiE
MQRDYYIQYYHLERKNWWFLVRLSIIRQAIKKNVYQGNPLKILNIGVATGASSDMLSLFGDVVSSEYDEETCRFLKENLNIEVIQASVTDLPFEDNSFDLVCAFDVIEHVEDDVKAYAEMKRVCKITGHIATTVPAFMVMWSNHDVVNHHFRRYTKKGIFQLLVQNQLKVTYSSYFNTILFLPVLLFRTINNVINKNKIPKSDFHKETPTIINQILKTIFSLELHLLKFIKFPFGVSYINISEKVKSPS